MAAEVVLMTKWAVHNLATRAIEIDSERYFSVAPDGPKYRTPPLAKDDGYAIFDTFEEAEAWRLGHEG